MEINLSQKDFEKAHPFPKWEKVSVRRRMAYLDSVQARLVALRELQSATGDELSTLLSSVLYRAFKGRSLKERK